MSNFTRRKLMQWAGRGALGSFFLGGLFGRRATAQSVPFVGLALSPGGTGLWKMDQIGRIASLGTAPAIDDASIIPCVRPSPYLAMVALPAGFYGEGGVVAMTLGGQFSAFGSFELKALQFVLVRTSPLPTQHLPYVAMAAMPDGSGLWALDLRGRLSTFGSAPNFGDAAIIPCVTPSPYVAMVPTPLGDGLYALTQSGRISTFGNATPIGDGSIIPCVQPVPFVAMAITPDGDGLWALDLLGRVKTLGSATPLGDGATAPCYHPSPYVALVPTPSGGGLYALNKSGQLRTFGDAVDFSAPLP